MHTSGSTACWIATLAALLLGEAAQLALSQEAVYNAKPGKYAVETASYDWLDTARQREVPVKLYYPSNIPKSGRIVWRATAADFRTIMRF